MPIFRYTAISLEGQTVEGDLQADDVKAAVEQLLASHLKVQSIQEAEAPVTKIASSSGDDEGLLRTQLDRMVTQRAAIAPALVAYAAEMPSGVQRDDVRRMAHEIQHMETAADLPQPITPGWARLACASACGRGVPNMIRALSQRHQAIQTTHQSVGRMMAYPAVILLASLVAFGAFSYLIVPVVREIFALFEFELPPFTSLVLWIAQCVTSIQWYWYVLVVLLAIAFLRRFRSQRNSPADDRFTAMCTFVDSLADLIEAATAIPPAVRAASLSVVAPALRRSAGQLASQIENDRVAGPISGIPHSLVHALTCTEQPIATAHLLRELSTIYRMTSVRRTQWMLILLEPLAIVVVGLTTGFVFFAIMLPMISLITNLSF